MAATSLLEAGEFRLDLNERLRSHPLFGHSTVLDPEADISSPPCDVHFHGHHTVMLVNSALPDSRSEELVLEPLDYGITARHDF